MVPDRATPRKLRLRCKARPPFPDMPAVPIVEEGQMSTLLDLPFQLGEPRASDGLVVTPVYPTTDPVCDYVSLDEALEGGLAVAEVSPEGSVGELRVRNSLGTAALL